MLFRSEAFTVPLSANIAGGAQCLTKESPSDENLYSSKDDNDLFHHIGRANGAPTTSAGRPGVIRGANIPAKTIRIKTIALLRFNIFFIHFYLQF